MKREGRSMQAAAEALKDYFVTQGTSLGLALAVVSVILIGVAFIIPYDKLKEWAKAHVLGVIVGIAILLSATTLVTEFASKFQTQTQAEQNTGK